MGAVQSPCEDLCWEIEKDWRPVIKQWSAATLSSCYIHRLIVGIVDSCTKEQVSCKNCLIFISTWILLISPPSSPILPSLRWTARWLMAACWEMPTVSSQHRAEWRIPESGRSRGSLGKLWWSAVWSNGSSPAHSHRTKVRGGLDVAWV